MSRFLVYNDYKTLIQKDDLSQILGKKEFEDLSDEAKEVLLELEFAGQEEMSSYLRNRYITEQIFAPTQEWSSGDTYFGKNLIFYTEPVFSTVNVYSLGQRCSYKDKIYECISVTGSTGDVPLTATTLFNYITNNETFYYAKLPVSEFSPKTNYVQGNLVWYEDNIYQAKQGIYGTNPAQSQNLELRYGIPSVQGFLGVFTDTGLYQTTPINFLPNVNSNFWDLYNGPVSTWFTGSTYYFSGISPDNATYFTKADNRNPQIKMFLIDIILYHLHSRINPRNIPDLRAVRYDGNNSLQTGGAIGWLKSIEKGKISLNCPEISPAQGNNIRFGSYPKANNNY